MEGLSRFAAALAFQGGYNVTLVTIGAALLGAAAGAAGTFLFLRKRALVSDALSHATLPGVALAFIAMAAAGGSGRWLPGLIAGAAVTALAGLMIVEWLTRRTRLSEDAAIGAVLSVFFGAGVVLLTVIQTLGIGQPAGLEGFLLGATAGMLASEAIMIAAAGALAAALVWALRRPMTLVAFDAEYAAASGVPVRAVDFAIMGLVLIVTVVGLKVVGLVLIIALLIIPPAAARFWSDRIDRIVLIAALIGGLAAWLGAAASASADALPTGPMIVLAAFALFLVSMLCAPLRGALAAGLRRWRFQLAVHRRQGLLALARGEAIYDRTTLTVLRRAGFILGDGAPTLDGRAAAARAATDEARWRALEARGAGEGTGHDSLAARLAPIERALTADQIADLDAAIGLTGPDAAVPEAG